MKINKLKTVICLVVFGILLTANSVLAIQEDIALKIISGDTEKTLTMEEIKDLPALEGWGGRMRSTGAVASPFALKGVSVIDLCDMVGGINPDMAVKIISRDGYAMTFSYKQVTENDFITYDPVSKNEVPHGDLHMILAYQTDGEEMPFELGGPLRLAILSEKNQVTDGHWWSKWIEKIELVPAPKEWVLQLKGARDEDVDRATFESGAAEGCHGTKYVDDKDREWEGIPLWLLVGRVDDDNPHEDKAFNDLLVQDGYEVEIIAEDGFSATLPISFIARRNNIVVAYKLNGEFLPENYWPLRLVGDDLTGKEKVGQIKEIKVIFP